MKETFKFVSGRRLILWLAGGLTLLAQATNAQVGGGVIVRNGEIVAGAGPAGTFTQRIDGAGTDRGIVLMIGGPGGGIDVGASLLKACDNNQDGVAAAGELSNALLVWFQQADTDTNGALSTLELTAVLNHSFPVPPPPPGLPPIPDAAAVHTLLAANLLAAADADQDSSLSLKEALAFVNVNFPQWDSDGSGSLDASEFAGAFGQLLPPPRQVFEYRR